MASVAPATEPAADAEPIAASAVAAPRSELPPVDSSTMLSRALTNVSLIGWILGSIFSSVSLILVNKFVMQEPYNFKFVFTLTAAHFTVTALGMEVMAMMKFFKRSRMPLLEMLLMAAMCIGSVAFMNFSLQYNSVGFYQVTKLLTIPCMVFLDRFVYGKFYSRRLYLTLAIVLLGVAVATVTDMQVSAVGSVFGALAVAFTTQFQIWQGQKQKQHGLDAMQINHSQSPPAAVLCGLLALIFECQGTDPKTNVLLHEFSADEVRMIFFSCILALSVNMCTYALIGKTSPVTFQVVGHAKTCLILIGGFVFFPLPPANLLIKNVIGICIALAGVIIYGEVKMKGDQIPRGKDIYDSICPTACLSCMDGDEEDVPSSPVAYSAVPLMPSHSPRPSPSMQQQQHQGPVYSPKDKA
jgi:solute carrier family 35 protein E3